MIEWTMRNQNASRHTFVDAALRMPLRPVWQTPLRESIVAPPIAVDDHVYLSTFNRLHALDIRSGAVEWSVYLGPPGSDIARATNKASPAIWRDRLYFTTFFFGGYVWCIDRQSGTALWNKPFHTLDESIAVYDNHLFLKTSYAVNTEQTAFRYGYYCITPDGEKVWLTHSDDMLMTKQCAIANGILVFGDLAGYLYGLNSTNGDIVWKVQTKPLVQIPNPHKEIYPFGFITIIESTILVNVGSQQHLLAFDLATGTLKWQAFHHRGMYNRAIDDHAIYYVNSRDTCGCLDLHTGEKRWEIDHRDKQLGGMALSDSCGIVVGDYYIAGAHDRYKLFAFDKRTGALVWDFAAQGGFRSDPIFIDGHLLVGDEMGNLYCFESA